MGRFSSVLLVALLVGAVAVRGDDDPWFPDPWKESPPPPPLYPAPDAPSPYYDNPPKAPEAPSPYYDSPPYDGEPPSDGKPYPPPEGKPYPPPEGEPYPPPEGKPYPPPSDGKPPPYDGEPPLPDGGSPPTYPPSYGPGPYPWHSSGDLWSQKTSEWPAPWKPDTPIEDAFGSDAVKVYGQVSMLDGITSKGDDGYSDLLKEGITALLNAVDAHFKYTEDEIKKCFSFKTALSSEAAATVQAQDFEAANVAVSNP